MEWIFTDLVPFLAQMTVSGWFMLKFIEARRMNLWLTGFIAAAAGVFLLKYFVSNTFTFFLLIIYLLLSIIPARIKKLHALLFFVINVAIILFQEGIWTLLLIMINPDVDITYTNIPMATLFAIRYSAIFSLFALTYICYRLCSRFIVHKDDKELNRYAPFLMAEVLTILSIYSVMLWIKAELPYYYLLTYYFLPFIGFTLLDVLLVGTVRRLHKAQKAEHELIETRNLLDYVSSSYAQFQENYSMIRQLRHDMQNQLQSIGWLLDEGKTTEALQQFNEYESKISKTANKVYTGNPAADAVIYFKAAMCEEKGIDFTCSGSLPSDLKFEAAELCSLVANILDNAVHGALAAEEPGNRFINFSTGLWQNRLIFKCENTCSINARVPEEDSDNIDHEHGWGISIIRRIADFHGGHTVFSVEDRCFTVKIDLEV